MYPCSVRAESTACAPEYPHLSMETVNAPAVSCYVPFDAAACHTVDNAENHERVLPLSAHSIHFSSSGPYDVMCGHAHFSPTDATHHMSQKTPSVSSTHLVMCPPDTLNDGSTAMSSSSHVNMCPPDTLNNGGVALFSSSQASMFPSATLNGDGTSFASGAHSSSLFFADTNEAQEHRVPFYRHNGEIHNNSAGRIQAPPRGGDAMEGAPRVGNPMEGALVMVDAEELMDGHDEEIDHELLDISEMLAHSLLRMLWRSNQMESIMRENDLAAGDAIPFIQRHLSRHVPQLIPLLQDSDACTTSSDESTEETESTVTSEFSDL